jgi:hypothetical protein
MEIESLSCNNCGGPLDIPESANYVSCVHCSTQLAVKRTSSITYTEKLEAIQSQQEDMREKLVRLERESLVARIDREWEEEKQRFMIGGNDGQKTVPTDSSFALSYFMILFMIVFTIVSGMIFWPMAIWGLILTGGGVWHATHISKKAAAFQVARGRYKRRRREATEDSSSSSDASLDPESP